MSGKLLHVNATVTCPHGAQATAQPAQARVLVAGQAVTSTADLYTVTGCPFNVAGKPQPCVTIRWVLPSARIRVNGSPALPQSAVGLCQSAEQIPQGPPIVTVVQQRVDGV
ncbi:hypothetical protein [Streptomyces novaecaesareae]|uniref:hypothetical protein n=1 Tax=Streptomyces novaecaesareae TaxID=68244 RepID=UPI0004A9DE8B|nr:hypothetical protein [Streptomyces novaecaesareae]